MTRETVFSETPACSATSLMVALRNRWTSDALMGWNDAERGRAIARPRGTV
jgi:hypothetical protein